MNEWHQGYNLAKFRNFFSIVICAEDFETSLGDYKKALSILEQLVEPDDRKIADLYPCLFHYISLF